MMELYHLLIVTVSSDGWDTSKAIRNQYINNSDEAKRCLQKDSSYEDQPRCIKKIRKKLYWKISNRISPLGVK